MKLAVAIDTRTLPQADEQAATAIKLGARGINIYPAQIREAAGQVDDAVRVFREKGVEVAQVACWDYNPLLPEAKAREDVMLAIEFAGKYGGTSTVVFGAGGLNPQNPWIAHPDNWKTKTREAAANTIKPLAELAERNNTRIALEPQFANVCKNAEATFELLELIGSKAVGLSMDVVNYCTYDHYWDANALIDEVIGALGDRCYAVHLKDITMEPRLIVHMSECPAGQGVLEYEYLLARLDRTVGSDDWAIVEHTPPEMLESTFDFVRAKAAKVDVEFR